jgi:hypothetical protein
MVPVCTGEIDTGLKEKGFLHNKKEYHFSSFLWFCGSNAIIETRINPTGY